MPGTFPAVRSWSRVLAASVLIAMPTVVGCEETRQRANSDDSIELDGEEMGSLVLDALVEDGDDIDLRDARGRIVVLNFWSSRCAPCVREMPLLQRAHVELGANGDVVGIAVADRATDASAFASTMDLTYAMARDPVGEVFAILGAPGLPATVVLGPDGNVIRRLFGEVDASELRGALAEAGIRIDLNDG